MVLQTMLRFPRELRSGPSVSSYDRGRAPNSKMATQAIQTPPACEARWLGTAKYDDGLRLQARAVEQLRAGEGREPLLLVEHPHVFTLGRGANSSNILADQQQLQSSSVEVHETGRGGDVTYHGPGQLVGYPIINLRP